MSLALERLGYLGNFGMLEQLGSRHSRGAGGRRHMRRRGGHLFSTQDPGPPRRAARLNHDTFLLSRAHDTEGQSHRSRARQARLGRLHRPRRAATVKVVEVAARVARPAAAVRRPGPGAGAVAPVQCSASQ